MLIGYVRVSKADGSQTTDLQRDALLAAGVDSIHIYEDHASGKREDRPGLANCLKALRPGDTLIIWKLDRLGRDLRHLINTVHDLTGRNIGLKVLTGHGASIDTTTAAGKLVFGIFAALAEFERALIAERTVAGLASARARGRKGGMTALACQFNFSQRKESTMKEKKVKSMPMNTGISEADRKKIVEGLSALLADSYTLYLMTHNFHWNVTGPQFNSLHMMFMDQYTEQWNALDVIAERIRALGFPAPGTYKEFVKLASIQEVEGVPKANEMIAHLVAAQEATARTARKLFPVADEANDQPTADVLTQRIDVHEKTAWMLRSLLED